jgi:hypothetical protein
LPISYYVRYVVRMPTVKKPPGRKRGEVAPDDVVAAAAAIGIVDRPPQSDDKIEEKR